VRSPSSLAATFPSLLLLFSSPFSQRTQSGKKFSQRSIGKGFEGLRGLGCGLKAVGLGNLCWACSGGGSILINKDECLSEEKRNVDPSPVAHWSFCSPVAKGVLGCSRVIRSCCKELPYQFLSSATNNQIFSLQIRKENLLSDLPKCQKMFVSWRRQSTA
jgi:hypothetical protein